MERKRWGRWLAMAALVVMMPPPASGQTAGAEVRRTLTEAGLDAATVARLTDGLTAAQVRREAVQRSGRAPLQLVFVLQPATGHQPQRIVDTTIGVVALLDDWLGAGRFDRLTIVDAPWATGLSGAAFPGVAMTSSRWRAGPDDRALERSLIGALARQYWGYGTRRDDATAQFAEGLAVYTGTRAAHEWLDGRHAAVVRFFGGVVPRGIRALQLSGSAIDPRPRLPWFDEIGGPSVPSEPLGAGGMRREVRRVVLAIATLERYIGWPALRAVLAEFRDRGRNAGLDADAFVAIAGEQRGLDLGWFADAAFRPDGRHDYGIERFVSEADARGAGLGFRTTITVRRFGERVFAGTSRVGADVRALPVSVTFADGTTVRDRWDAGAARSERVYASRVPAASVTVDPDMVLLLDADRSNNTRTLAPRVSATGARLAWHWLTWLEDLILTTVALA